MIRCAYFRLKILFISFIKFKPKQNTHAFDNNDPLLFASDPFENTKTTKNKEQHLRIVLALAERRTSGFFVFIIRAR